MKRKCVIVLAILVLMQVLCGVQSAPKAQTAESTNSRGEKADNLSGKQKFLQE